MKLRLDARGRNPVISKSESDVLTSNKEAALEAGMGLEQSRSGRFTGRELLVLLVLAGVHFANVMDFMIIMPLGPQYQEDLDITPQAFGWLVSVYGFSSSLSGLTAAWFLDRFDRKRSLLVIFGGFTTATLLCAVSGNYYYLLAARGLAGVFGGIMAATVMA